MIIETILQQTIVPCYRKVWLKNPDTFFFLYITKRLSNCSEFGKIPFNFYSQMNLKDIHDLYDSDSFTVKISNVC